jgi:chromosome segregation ATPase
MMYLSVGLAVLAAVTLWRTLAGEGERARITRANLQLTQTVQQLETERAKLQDELEGTRETIAAQTEDLTGLRQELETTQADLNQTVTALASLKRDFQDVQNETGVLAAQLAAVMTEKEQLEAKLSSVKELKLAIREIKRKAWEQRWAAWRVRLRAHRRVEDEDHLVWGNQGYVVRDGVSTLGAGSRMHVQVLEPQTQ